MTWDKSYPSLKFDSIFNKWHFYTCLDTPMHLIEKTIKFVKGIVYNVYHVSLLILIIRLRYCPKFRLSWDDVILYTLLCSSLHDYWLLILLLQVHNHMTTPIELLVILPMKSPFVLTTVQPNEVYAVPFNVLFTAVLCVRPRDIEYVDSINVLYVSCTCYRCVYMLSICILGSLDNI